MELYMWMPIYIKSKTFFRTKELPILLPAPFPKINILLLLLHGQEPFSAIDWHWEYGKVRCHVLHNDCLCLSCSYSDNVGKQGAKCYRLTDCVSQYYTLKIWDSEVPHIAWLLLSPQMRQRFWENEVPHAIIVFPKFIHLIIEKQWAICSKLTTGFPAVHILRICKTEVPFTIGQVLVFLLLRHRILGRWGAIGQLFVSP